MAFFPEIFGRNQTKYQRVAGWLASRYGIVDSSLRDRFTAGGKVTIKVSNNSYVNVPRIFKNLNDSFSKVLKVIRSAEIDDLKYYWSKDDLRIYDKLIEIWLRLVLAYADESYPKGRKFLINLIGAHLKDKRPNFIKEDYNRYGLL